jgi:hypothetical protein
MKSVYNTVNIAITKKLPKESFKEKVYYFIIDIFWPVDKILFWKTGYRITSCFTLKTTKIEYDYSSFKERGIL